MKETTFLRVQKTLGFVNSTRNILGLSETKHACKKHSYGSLGQVNESQKCENPGTAAYPLKPQKVCA